MRYVFSTLCLMIISYYIGLSHVADEVPLSDQDEVTIVSQDCEAVRLSESVATTQKVKPEVSQPIVRKSISPNRQAQVVRQEVPSKKVDNKAEADFEEQNLYQGLELTPGDLTEVRTIQYEAMNFLSDQFVDQIIENPDIAMDSSNPVYAKLQEDYTNSLLEYMSLEDAQRITFQVLEGQ